MNSKNNNFLESLKVDTETQARLAEVSKNYNNSKKNLSSKKSADEGGRERGDDGPGSLGRESGFKKGNNEQLSNCFNAINSYKGKAKTTSISPDSSHGNAINGSAKSSHGASVKGGHVGASVGGISGGLNGGHSGSSGGHGGSSGGHGR